MDGCQEEGFSWAKRSYAPQGQICTNNVAAVEMAMETDGQKLHTRVAAAHAVKIGIIAAWQELR